MQQLSRKLYTFGKYLQQKQTLLPYQLFSSLASAVFKNNKSKTNSSVNGYTNCTLAFSNGVDAETQRTALYDLHLQHGGKMMNFGGSLLPVQYVGQSIIASHLYTRSHGSIFDVSHMLQTWLRGKDSVRCLESICSADIAGTANGTAMLTVFTCAENGGILDDVIVTKVDEQTLYVVSNAAMKQQDMELMSAATSQFKADGKDVVIEFLPNVQQSLIAVQGPKAVATLEHLVQRPLNKLLFMQSTVTEIAGVPNCRVTRCGYTGEDGVEISVESSKVQQVTNALLQVKLDSKQLRLAGLGARDSLRLEAGLCLYGSDIDAKITPIEAGLSWLVAKRRRHEANFPGADIILEQLQTNGLQKRRVGLLMQGTKVPAARPCVQIFNESKNIGNVTSGCPSPTLGKNIAMGYVLNEFKCPGSLVNLKIRDKMYAAEVVNMPFVMPKYYLKPKNKQN